MPPSAAPEWLRVGCSLEMPPTFAPASYASMAARMPAQPAPTTRTSCVASTRRTLPKHLAARRHLRLDLGRFDDPQGPVAAVDPLGPAHLGEARPQQAHAAPVPLEDRAHVGQDRRHERPGTHLAVHLDGGLRQVDVAGVVLEDALGIAGLP